MRHRIRVLFAMGSMAGGGSERQMVTLLEHIDRARFDPLLYLIYRRGELLPEIPPDVPVRAFGDECPHPRWNLPGRIHLAQVRHLGRVLAAERADVVYDRTMVMTLVAGPAARRARVPRISVVVADPERDLKSLPARFRWAKRRLLRRAYAQAEKVVAVSEALRARMMDYHGVPPHRVTVIRNPIDLARADRLAAQSPERFGDDRFHVVASGRLQEQKGYVYLLDAVDRLVNARRRKQLMLHVLGQGPQEPMLRSLVVQKGLEEHVRFEGFQANPFQFYRPAHLVCLASVFEGLPNVLLEAMACRTPVLATDCPTGPREIVDGGRLGGLVPPADAAALADAIDDAMARYDRWLQRTGPARAWLEKHFSVEQSVRAVEQLLFEAATGKR